MFSTPLTTIWKIIAEEDEQRPVLAVIPASTRILTEIEIKTN
jgi:hypothetical protein